jgi:sacsin
MSKRGIKKIAAGQREKLTVRLNGLIRNYPKGPGIFKEFIQNADDAGARRVRIILDNRTYPTDGLTCSAEAEWAGPSLLIFNDATFEDRDFAAIQTIGEGSKLDAGWKTGRFGLGFNAAYNVTDFPSFLSRDRLLFFDPHHRHPDAEKNTGGGWELSEEMWEDAPGVLRLYEVGGLARGQTSYDATLFRLPLRSSPSEICTEPFTPADFHAIVRQFADTAAAVLLFLKNVLHVEIIEIPADGGEPQVLLEIATRNDDEVRQEREPLNKFAKTDYADLIRRLRKGSKAIQPVSYLHRVLVTLNATSASYTWRVVGGLYVDEGQELLDAAEAMRKQGEKALPWAGAAALIVEDADGTRVEKVDGKLFCFLPLPGDPKLPVHLNAFFDLDSSRQGLTSNTENVGKDEIRVRWNQSLAEHAVSQAYADLIVVLVNDVSPGLGNLYTVWPRQKQMSGFLGEAGRAVYAKLGPQLVIKCAGEEQPWATVGDLSILPEEWTELQEPAVRLGLSIPSPRLPAHITDGFRIAGVGVRELTPGVLRDRIRVNVDLGVSIKDAEQPWLRLRKWVVDLLRYCLSDQPGPALKGIPLALLTDGKLHTFGFSVSLTVFIADAEQRALFSSFPHWFLDPEFSLECVPVGGIPSVPHAGLRAMTVQDVLANLNRVLDPTRQQQSRSWGPGGEDLPNAPWLSRVYAYLTRHLATESAKIEETLKTLPVVPDQYRFLCLPGHSETPLIVVEELARDERLMSAVDSFHVRRVQGAKYLTKAIRDFADAYDDGLIWHLTGPDLVDTLHATREEWLTDLKQYRPEVHDAIIDFFAETRWSDRYQPEHLKRLATLPIFPTEAGDLVTLDTSDVYLHTGFEPPFSGTAKLLKTNGERWTLLLRRMVERRMDRASFIRDILLPQYETFDTARRIEVLGWLLLELPMAESDLEQASVEAAAAFRKLVKSAPLIECNDGALRPAARVYHPHKKIVREVLGADVPYPEMSLYSRGEDRWLRSFVDLGISFTPQPEDLLRHVDRLIQKAASEGTASVAPAIQVVYEHLREHWDHQFETAYVEDPTSGSQRVSMGTALSRRRWLLPRRDFRRGTQFFAATVPEDRLYQPSELFPASLGHLLASQRPISGYVQPGGKFAAALAFPKSVPVDVVAAHLDRVLEVWAPSDHSDQTNVKTFETSVTEIYRYLGRRGKGEPLTENDGTGEGDDEGLRLSLAEMDALRARYEDRPCLWEKGERRLWKPKHTFQVRVSFFQPLRRKLVVSDVNADRGFDLLGRRDEPVADDYVSFLRDLMSDCGENVVPTHLIPNVIEVQRRLGELQVLSNGFGSIPVLCQDLRQRLPEEVLIPDAVWFEGRFSPERCHLIHVDTSPQFAELAGVWAMSECVTEHLAVEPELSDNPDLEAECQRLSDLIHTREFRLGLERLIRSQSTAIDFIANLHRLAEMTVVPVKGLQVELVLTRADGDVIRDVHTPKWFLSGLPLRIYLGEKVGRLSTFSVALALQQHLDGLIHDKSFLLEMLSVRSDEIEQILDELRVKRLLKGGDSSAWQDEDDDDPNVDLSDPEAGSEQESTDESAHHAATEDEVGVPDAAADDQPNDSETKEQDGDSDPGTHENLPEKDLAPPGHTGERATAHPVSASGSSATSQSSNNSAAATAARGNDGTGGEVAGSSLTGGNGVKGIAPSPSTQKPNSSDAESGAPAGTPRPLTSASSPRGFTESRLPHSGRQGIGGSNFAGPKLPGKERPWPPNDPGRRKGKSKGRRGRVTTYMVPDDSPERERHDPADDEQPQNMAIGAAAVEAVRAYEAARGRTIQELGHTHPGYDVDSSDASGTVVRRIEIKGVDGEWADAGVPLSRTQFEAAQTRRDGFWLYVVEYARNPQRQRVFAIRNPYERVTQFRCDGGWRVLSEEWGSTDGTSPSGASTTAKPLPFEKGQQIQLSEEESGVVLNVQQSRKFVSLQLKMADGMTRSVWYNPDSGKFMFRKE